MFDMSKSLTLAGTVTDFQWTNPHVYIEIDVPGDKGAHKPLERRNGQPEHPDPKRLEIQQPP